jgi:hypothetical protein
MGGAPAKGPGWVVEPWQRGRWEARRSMGWEARAASGSISPGKVAMDLVR